MCVSHVDAADFFLKKKERNKVIIFKRDDLLKLSLKRERFSQQFHELRGKIPASTLTGGWIEKMEG